MSGSGSTTTKPVPAPRRGRNPKEPSVSDKLQNVRLLFQNTVRQFYEWMHKLGKCVCSGYQKRRNFTKVGQPTEKRTFRCPRGRRIFLHKSLLSVRNNQVRNWAAMLSQIREKLNTPTDNEQLLRLKKLSKSPHSNPLLRDLALLITIRENLNSLLTLKAHSRTRRKSLKIIQIQEALWRNQTT